MAPTCSILKIERVGKMSSLRPARVIFMHGLGDTPHGWADTLRSAFQEALPHVTFVLPEAPRARVTCNGGMQMTSWMDLHAIPVTPDNYDDEPSLSSSVALVHRLIDRAVESGIPPERVVVGGFSQGAAMAFLSTLRYPKRLGGCVMLSGWPPLANKEKISESANAKTVSYSALCAGSAPKPTIGIAFAAHGTRPTPARAWCSHALPRECPRSS
jgi:predicted esterase